MREALVERMAPGWLVAGFVAVAAGVMLSLSAVLPLGEGPDEPAHVVRTAGLMRGQILGHRVVAPHPADGAPVALAGYDINPAYVWVMAYKPRAADGSIAQVTQEEIRKARAIPWTAPSFFAESSNTASYAPFLYVPGAIGMGVARLVGASPFDTVHAGRLANVLAYVLIGAAAIWLADRGRLLLTTLLMLPMSLFMGSCIGQDGLIIALSCLAAAALGRASPAGRERYVWIGVAALALIAMAKPPYVPLYLLVLGCGVMRHAAWSRLVLWTACTAIPGVLWTVAAAARAAVPFWRPPYRPGPLWSGPADTMLRTSDPVAQVGILFAQPLRLITLPFASFVQDWDNLVLTFVGVLGWLDILLPDDAYLIWEVTILACLVLGLVAGRWRFGARPLVGWACTAAGIVAAIFAVYLAQYVSWSDVGAATVGGVQGRYLISLAALLALLLPRVAPGLRRVHDLACLVPIGLGAWGGVTSLQLVLTRYYLP